MRRIDLQYGGSFYACATTDRSLAEGKKSVSGSLGHGTIGPGARLGRKAEGPLGRTVLPMSSSLGLPDEARIVHRAGA